ncbi:MAG: SCO family protein [Roseicyclus sp.]
MRVRALVAAMAMATPLWAQGTPAPLPFDLGGPFSLIDHTGSPRSEVDPDGRMQLVFFGYANCQQICSAALPLMGDVADALHADGLPLSIVMITVDPARDTVDAIGAPLHDIHPGFIGLTGDDAALQVAYDAFGIEREELFIDLEYGPVYAHGSFMYLLDANGAVQTVLPPVLAPGQMAQIVRSYMP